jgi:hypothetical protein
MKSSLPWIALLAFSASMEAALWAPLSLEQLLDQSDLIVVGELTSVRPQTASSNDLATLRIDSVLLSKGAQTAGQVTLAVHGRQRPVASDTLVRSVGERGIWFLRRDPASTDVFLADHPHRLRPEKDLETVRTAIKARKR